jgi:hypothetical protein
MENNNKKLQENVNTIFVEVYYVFFLRWVEKIKSEEDVIKMTEEARELSRRHGDIDLVQHITVNLATMLEQDYLSRGKADE